MAYTLTNYRTKKALLAAVNDWQGANIAGDPVWKKKMEVRVRQTGVGPNLSNYTGTVIIEGPHYPATHTWYATAEMINGVVVSVK